MAAATGEARMNRGQITPESTPGPDPQQLVADKQNHKGSDSGHGIHGLLTPDTTPAPEDARIEADKLRQQAEAATPSAAATNTNGAPDVQSKPAFETAGPEGPDQTETTGNKRKRTPEKDSKVLKPVAAGVAKGQKRTIKKTVKKKIAGQKEGEDQYEEVEVDVEMEDAEPQEEQPPVDPSGSHTVPIGPLTDAGESNAPGTDEITTSTGATAWQPGLTRQGEPILGYRTIGGDSKGNARGYQFLVKAGTEEKPQYHLRSGSELGRRAAEGYMNLPSGQIRLGEADEKYDRRNAKDYTGVKGIASKPIQTRLANSNFRYPAAYCLVTFQNPNREVWIWRSTLRRVLGKTDADEDIKDYYKRNALTPPWEVEPVNVRFEYDKAKSAQGQKGVSDKTPLGPIRKPARSVKADQLNPTQETDQPKQDLEADKAPTRDELQAKVMSLENKLDTLLQMMQKQAGGN